MFIKLTVGYSKTEVLTEGRVMVSLFFHYSYGICDEKMALGLVL